MKAGSTFSGATGPDAHSLNQELNEALAEGGDPERFGKTVTIWVGVNPDV
jgi:hypothetical protein